jgi:hypothetical protein
LPDVVTAQVGASDAGGAGSVDQDDNRRPRLSNGQMASEVAGRWIVSIEDPSGEWRLQGEWLVDSGEALRLVAKAEQVIFNVVLLLGGDLWLGNFCLVAI